MKNVKQFRGTSVRIWWHFLITHFRMARISDSAVVLAYYILLSIFPLLIIVGSVFKLAGLNYVHLMETLRLICPTTIFKFMRPIIYSALKDGGKTQLSIGLLVTVWSASRMIAAFQRTVNSVYGIKRPSAFFNQVLSYVWMLVFILMAIGIIIFSLFSKVLLRVAVHYLHGTTIIIKMLDQYQLPFTILTFYGVVCLLYYFVPIIKVRMKYIWCGALISSVGILLLSKGFSLYLMYFTNSLSAYRALGAFIILMFWLYFLGLLLLFGVVVNATDQDYQNEKFELKPMVKRVRQMQLKHQKKPFRKRTTHEKLK